MLRSPGDLWTSCAPQCAKLWKNKTDTILQYTRYSIGHIHYRGVNQHGLMGTVAIDVFVSIHSPIDATCWVQITSQMRYYESKIGIGIRDLSYFFKYGWSFVETDHSGDPSWRHTFLFGYNYPKIWLSASMIVYLKSYERKSYHAKEIVVCHPKHCLSMFPGMLVFCFAQRTPSVSAEFLLGMDLGVLVEGKVFDLGQDVLRDEFLQNEISSLGRHKVKEFMTSMAAHSCSRAGL